MKLFDHLTQSDDSNLEIKVQVSRFDASVTEEFRSYVDSQWDDEVEEITLDMSAVQFIDSSGVGALIGLRKRLGGGSVNLRGVTSHVRGVIELLRLQREFTLQD